MGHDGTKGVLDVDFAVFHHQVHHFVLSPHWRSPTLQHTGERPPDAASWSTVVGLLDPDLAKAVSAAFAFVKVAHAARHGNKEAIHACVGGLGNGVHVESTGGNAAVVSVTGVVDEAQSLVDQLNHVVGIGAAPLVSGFAACGAVARLVAVVELPDLLETIVEQLVLDHVLVLPVALVVVANASAFVGADAHAHVEPLFTQEGVLLVFEGAVHQGLHLGHVVHEQAAHKEFGVVVVAFHKGITRIAVSISSSVGHQGGGHLVLVSGQNHVGEPFLKVSVGQVILDGVVVIAKVCGVNHLGGESFFALPLHQGSQHVVVHGIGDHDQLAVLFDVVIAGVPGGSVQEAATQLVGEFGCHPDRCHRGVHSSGLVVHDANRDGGVAPKHVRDGVVLEWEGPNALAANATLHKRRLQ